MGQFGSFGYATGLAGAPWSHTQILDHFYGGTTMGDIGNPLMMVHLKDRPTGRAMVVNRETGPTIGRQADTPPAIPVTPRPADRKDQHREWGVYGKEGTA